LTDFPLIQNGTEPFKNSRVGFGRVLCEEGSNFACETNSNLDGIVCRPFKEEDEDLKSDNLMSDGLVD
jgi:hypothetical protein